MEFGEWATHIARYGMTRWFAVFTMLMLVVAVACSGADDNTQTCGGTLPGVVVQVPGIEMKVRDPFGVAQAIGTSATVRDAHGTQVYSFVDDTLNIGAAFWGLVAGFAVSWLMERRHFELD